MYRYERPVVAFPAALLKDAREKRDAIKKQIAAKRLPWCGTWTKRGQGGRKGQYRQFIAGKINLRSLPDLPKLLRSPGCESKSSSGLSNYASHAE